MKGTSATPGSTLHIDLDVVRRKSNDSQSAFPSHIMIVNEHWFLT